MKRFALFLFLSGLICVGCSQAIEEEQMAASDIGPQEKPIEITEKLFLLQINDVFYNFEEYEGKMLKVEGMYGFGIVEEKEYHVVYRFGPGCCDNDDWGGFFLNYDGQWPEIDEWIEVQGTPRIVKEGSVKWLYLDVTSLIVKEERGLEFVNQ